MWVASSLYRVLIVSVFQINRLISVCWQAKNGDGSLSHGSTRHASETALQHHARGQERYRESQTKYEHVCNLSLMFAINAASTSVSFHCSLFCVWPEWSTTWTWRSWCSPIMEKMYQSSTSWAQTALCKPRCNLPTIGETSLVPVDCYMQVTATLTSPRGLFLNSRMYDACCSTIETASLRMFKYGRTDAIRVTSVDSLKFVQAMQDPSKQVLLSIHARRRGGVQT